MPALRRSCQRRRRPRAALGGVAHADARTGRRQVSLDFNLRDDGATVGATIGFAPAGPSAGPLRLDGSPEVVLASISLDGTALAEGSGYTRTADGGLVLPDPPNRAFVLRTVITLDPADNTALEGLYLSSGNFCTQARRGSAPLRGACGRAAQGTC